MASPSFTNLIVTYNSANDIMNLLADLRTYAPASKVILIDNASKDRTAQLICELHPEVRLIQNPVNVGYARAVNQGFALCDTEFVLLLNPDIRITNHRLYSEMETCLKNSRNVAATAPLQFKDNGKKRYLNFTWSYTKPGAFRVYLSHRMRQNHMFSEPIRVTFLNAGCLFLRTSAFNQVGQLNEKYFMYGEEPDLFLKFKRYGFECYLLPNVDVTHYRERSLSTMPLFLRIRLRLQAVLNVTDALIIGWTRILFVKFTFHESEKVEGN